MDDPVNDPKVVAHIQQLKKRMPSEVSKYQQRQRQHAKKVRTLWSPMLDRYDIIHLEIAKLGRHIAETNNNRQDIEQDYLFNAMRDLHASANAVAREIGVLLSEGLVPGAMARWRTLYELAIIAAFLQKEGASVAETYLQHQEIKRLQFEEGHQNVLMQHGDADDKSKAEPRLKEIKARREALRAEHWPTFHRDYGWAWKVFDQERTTPKPDDSPTFTRIEERVEKYLKLRVPQYVGTANLAVHGHAASVLTLTGNPLLNRSDPYVRYTPTPTDVVLVTLRDYIVCTHFFITSQSLVPDQTMLVALNALADEAVNLGQQIEARHKKS